MSYLNFIPEWVLLAEYKAFEKNLIYVTVTALNKAILVQWQSTGVKVHGLCFLSAVHGFACTQLPLALTQFVHVAPVQ